MSERVSESSNGIRKKRELFSGFHRDIVGMIDEAVIDDPRKVRTDEQVEKEVRIYELTYE